MGLPSRILKQISLPPFLNKWRKGVLESRLERMEKIFKSAQIAYEELREETGLLYLRLLPDKNEYPQITLIYNLGISHPFDMNDAPFALQKRADLLFSYLDQHRAEAAKIAASLATCIKDRAKKGIANTDLLIHRNCGVINGEVVEIDIGSFVFSPLDLDSVFAEQILALKTWISKHKPDLSTPFKRFHEAVFSQ